MKVLDQYGKLIKGKLERLAVDVYDNICKVLPNATTTWWPWGEFDTQKVFYLCCLVVLPGKWSKRISRRSSTKLTDRGSMLKENKIQEERTGVLWGEKTFQRGKHMWFCSLLWKKMGTGISQWQGTQRNYFRGISAFSLLFESLCVLFSSIACFKQKTIESTAFPAVLWGRSDVELNATHHYTNMLLM